MRKESLIPPSTHNSERLKSFVIYVDTLYCRGIILSTYFVTLIKSTFQHEDNNIYFLGGWLAQGCIDSLNSKNSPIC